MPQTNKPNISITEYTISKHIWLILIEITQSPMVSFIRILIRYICVLKYTTHQMHLNWMKLPAIKELCHIHMIHPNKVALLKQTKCEACQNEHTATNLLTTISNNLVRFIFNVGYFATSYNRTFFKRKTQL